MGFESARCVVLNATYEPITIVSSKRALVLYLEGKAMIVEEHPELVVRSPSQTFPVPTSIVLKQFVKGRMVFRTKALLTQRNLFIINFDFCIIQCIYKNYFILLKCYNTFLNLFTLFF